MGYDSNFERHSPADKAVAPFAFHTSAEESRTLSAASTIKRSEAANEMIQAGQLPSISLIDNTVSASHESVFAYPVVRSGDHFYKTGLDVETTSSSKPLTDKLHDFVASAYRNAMNPKNYQAYFENESSKLVGIGEGLNMAKESTKQSAAHAFTALTDGTVLNAMSKPNAINEPLFKTVGDAVTACAANRNAVNHLLERGLQATLTVSEYYTNLPAEKQGQLIGKGMFGFINPDGSLTAANDALKIFDSVATHVDAAVMKGAESSKNALNAALQAAPEITSQTKQIANDVLKAHGPTGPQFEYAGVPKDYVNFSESKPSEKFNHLNAMKSETVKNNYGFERLRRTDLGEPREPYEWPAINEHFSDEVVRQAHPLSCVPAVAEMLSNGRLKEEVLFEESVDYKKLLEKLGPPWTASHFNLGKIPTVYPFGAELMPDFYGKVVQPHAVVVDGISPSGNFLIRDPWEGTKYEMSKVDFPKRWNGNAIYRTIENK